MKTGSRNPDVMAPAPSGRPAKPLLAGKTDSPIRRYRFEFGMMVPALLVLAAISLFPFFYLIWMSLNNVSLAGGLKFRFVGLDNWIQLFSDPQVGQSWWISLVYFVCTVGVEMV